MRKAQAAAWEEKFMAMKAKQKESNKVIFLLPTIFSVLLGEANITFMNVSSLGLLSIR